MLSNIVQFKPHDFWHICSKIKTEFWISLNQYNQLFFFFVPILSQLSGKPSIVLIGQLFLSDKEVVYVLIKIITFLEK